MTFYEWATVLCQASLCPGSEFPHDHADWDDVPESERPENMPTYVGTGV
jgi:hypothetical protein